MGGRTESSGRRVRIDAAAKAACLDGLLAGARVADLAAAIGVTPQALQRARKRDPLFDAGWRAAHAASAAAERGGAGRGSVGPAGEERIAANNLRGLQVRKMRHVRFGAKRQQCFLAHFAWSADTLAAAAAAGVCETTVYNQRRSNPAFAEEFQAALDQAYARLEAEALRQRLAAQQALRAAVERSEPGAQPGAAPLLPAEMAAEFERVLKLLARWDRKPRRPERHAAPDGRQEPWSFEGAIALLNRRLAALGMAVPPLPSGVAARYDGEAGEGEGAP
ncbi:hypothetical protein SH591_02775 [Sphingomonas sp. LY54]|uniref:hypothetical protein n=1 Tax=Sphingomonas sp. LY54 TaxID=3095343 RepID=UPI002D7659D5|nr:hypothetical protein [Sphingomonas sp. LY54]WRP29123.1 hypothetical protein SH591_02775 [Sphingomonas sp. LY54]